MEWSLEWYWWAVIVLVLVAGASLKLKILGKLMERRKKSDEEMALDE
jgi:hypothetical protein